MAGEGPPSTTCLAARGIVVDGGPSPAMTWEAGTTGCFWLGAQRSPERRLSSIAAARLPGFFPDRSGPESCGRPTLRPCPTPISSTSAPIPPTRSARARSKWTNSPPSPARRRCRRSPSPTPATCSAPSSSARYCAGKGIQPIIGCQLALTRTDNPRLAPEPIVLLAQDATGLANLQRLSSQGFLDTDPGQKPQLAVRPHRPARRRPDPADRRHHRPARPPSRRRPAPRSRTPASPIRRSLPRPHHRRTPPPRPAAGSRHRAGHDRPGRCTEPAAGRHQRLLLRHPRHVRGARRVALHRREPACCRNRNAAASPRSTGSSPPPTCARCSPTCRRRATTRSPSPAAAP